MKSWHIWDFPETIYFSFNDNFRNEFFDTLFKKFGGIRPAGRFFGLSQPAIRQYARGYSTKNKVKHPQSIPISFLKKFMKLVDEDITEKIEESIILIKAKNKGTPVCNPRLPFRESPAFYRVVAHMIGDGSAPGNKVPYYANTCRELINQFREDLNIFGEVRTYDRKLTVPILSFPKVITDILAYILDVKFSYPDRIPKQIFNASEECKSAFLQALFDDEGCSSNGIAIGMKGYNIVSELKKLLETIGMETNNLFRSNGGMVSFSINSKSIELFKDKVGFSHPSKIKNLNFAISRKYRKMRTRSVEKIQGQILSVLEDKPCATIEIANVIQLTLGHTLKYLINLEEENKVTRTGFKNKFYWSIVKV